MEPRTSDWGIFRRTIQEWLDSYRAPNDINQLERDLVQAFHNAANAAMPRKVTGNYTYKDSWYYCPEVRKYKSRLNRVRKIYRRRPTENNREMLQAVSRDVHAKLNEIKTDKWLAWCVLEILRPQCILDQLMVTLSN